MTIVDIITTDQSNLTHAHGNLKANMKNVICQWFEETALKSATFKIAALKKVKAL